MPSFSDIALLMKNSMDFRLNDRLRSDGTFLSSSCWVPQCCIWIWVAGSFLGKNITPEKVQLRKHATFPVAAQSSFTPSPRAPRALEHLHSQKTPQKNCRLSQGDTRKHNQKLVLCSHPECCVVCSAGPCLWAHMKPCHITVGFGILRALIGTRGNEFSSYDLSRILQPGQSDDTSHYM